MYVTDRKGWRAWLEKHFESEPEIWLIYPKQATGKPCIVYNDAVEEALCFGWIDSIRKSLDEDHSVQRFSPRRSKSSFSQQNIERLNWLAENELIHPSVLPSVQPILEQEFIFPPDIIAAIQENAQAWQHYQNFSPAYQRIRVAYIDSARARPEEFDKRLVNFIHKTAENKQIGFGGIDKYF